MYRSLPGEYSHRIGTLDVTDRVLELNCVSELNARRGDGDTTIRVPISLARSAEKG